MHQPGKPGVSAPLEGPSPAFARSKAVLPQVEATPSRTSSAELARAVAVVATPDPKKPSRPSILPSPTSSVSDLHERSPGPLSGHEVGPQQPQPPATTTAETSLTQIRHGSADFQLGPATAVDGPTSRPGEPVSAFLHELGLGEYAAAFSNEGFDTMESVNEITESDMSHLGVKRGHRRVIQRAIASRRGISIDMPLNVSTSMPGVGTTSSAVPQAGRSVTQTNRNVFYINPGRVTHAPAESTGKRRYRRHPKPDANAPEKPPSAYVMFSNQVREELKGKTVSFTEIARLVGDRWKNLNVETKESIERKAADAKERWQALVAAYKKTPQHAEYQAYLVDFRAKHGPSRSQSQAGSATSRSSVSRPSSSSKPREGAGPSRAGQIARGSRMAMDEDEEEDEVDGLEEDDEEEEEDGSSFETRRKRRRSASPDDDVGPLHPPRPLAAPQASHGFYPYHLPASGSQMVFGGSAFAHHQTGDPTPPAYRRYSLGGATTATAAGGSASAPVGSHIILAGPPGPLPASSLPPTTGASATKGPGTGEWPGRTSPLAMHYPLAVAPASGPQPYPLSGSTGPSSYYDHHHLHHHPSTTTATSTSAVRSTAPPVLSGPVTSPVPGTVGFARPTSHTRGDPPPSSTSTNAGAAPSGVGIAGTSAAPVPTSASIRSGSTMTTPSEPPTPAGLGGAPVGGAQSTQKVGGGSGDEVKTEDARASSA